MGWFVGNKLAKITGYPDAGISVTEALRDYYSELNARGRDHRRAILSCLSSFHPHNQPVLLIPQGIKLLDWDGCPTVMSACVFHRCEWIGKSNQERQELRRD